MVVYFDVEGFPGKYFTCSRYGTMTATSCANNCRAAPKEFRDKGRLEGCIGCPIGAQHLAEMGPPAKSTETPLVPEKVTIYRQVCLRCRHSGRENTSRLVGRMRLIRDHTICVSCYNREREVLAGSNAKGAMPKKWSNLFVPNAAYLKDDKVVRTKMPSPVIDRIELVLTLVRQAGAVGVMWASAPVVRAA